MGLIPLYYTARAEKPHDSRRGSKRAEHDGTAAVLVDVRDGLCAGAGGINVSTLCGREDGEGGGREAFRGDVNVFPGQRRRSCEEEGLGEGPFC